MESFSYLLLLFLFSCLSPISESIKPTTTRRPPRPVKGVNLGGWLVTEGWITPNLFDEIPVNKDLLDGTQIHLKSITQNNFFCAENGGGSVVNANRPSAFFWETFKLWRITESTFQFRVFNWQFFGLDDQARLVAVSTSTDDSDSSKTFELVRNDDDPNRIRLKAPNGSFLQANSDGSVTANHPEDTNWGDDDPSVFLLNVVGQLQGEFQVTNDYGHDKASSVMTNGITVVRIQVGWWIMFEPNPPSPFVGGSLQALDNVVNWAEYASRSGLYAIELINEPLALGVTLDSLERYYKAGYNAVRNHTDAYVIMSNRLLTVDPTELVKFASGFARSVIDVHFYNLLGIIKNMMEVGIDWEKKGQVSE
ncbi:hypothetical protein HPP92_006295 [Vanilla planifolia]|uniref:DUF7910 domain-containing protein n=1 Tax=Vanilla planifolia TaxID=51239 RepID=A0A835RVM7_VANPL|nr:hypothetical protein HPP92_006295 [Vanilla planifolia]